ncbi:MAG TPA: 5,6-dimethylbenzimidazole synthase [Rhizomicrobium sp.]|jgi:5,6-dimethylbenzimidazole synthase
MNISATSRTDFDAPFQARLVDLFSLRRDVRQFKQEGLQAGTIERLIQTACLAPSVGLSEPWRFVIVRDPHRRAAIHACFMEENARALEAQSSDRAEAYARLKLEGLIDAPEHVAVFADRTTGQGHGLGRHSMPQMIEYSAVMAAHTFWLAARAEGIGVGWISILDPSRVIQILDIPPEWSFLGYLCVGYPITQSRTPKLEQDGWEYRRPPASAITLR